MHAYIIYKATCARILTRHHLDVRWTAYNMSICSKM